MKTHINLISAIMLLLPISAISIDRTPSPKDAKAYIASPNNGQTVYNPVNVRFGLKGMGIAPAGMEMANTGHFHILLDEEKLPDLNKPMPFGAHHLHYSNGHIEASLELSPGKHTLQLIMGDHQHIPHKPPIISKKITIVVKRFY